jgi:hypothetical protein
MGPRSGIAVAGSCVRISMGIILLACLALPAFQEDVPVGLTKGKQFPDFLLPDIEGGFGRLSDFRGKKVLVLSFASW